MKYFKMSLLVKASMVFLIAGSSTFLTGCETMYKVMPYYTEPGKLAQLEVDMPLSKVNSELGIEPYDVYHMQSDGSSILVYAYRKKVRKVTRAEKQENLYGANSQTSGEVWYTDGGFAYLLFNEGNLKSLITDEGRKNSKAILVTNNIIQLIGEKDLVNYREIAELWKVEGIRYEDEEDEKGADKLIIPLDNGKLKGIESIELNMD